jgi:hypothetical protein
MTNNPLNQRQRGRDVHFPHQMLGKLDGQVEYPSEFFLRPPPVAHRVPKLLDRSGHSLRIIHGRRRG